MKSCAQGRGNEESGWFDCRRKGEGLNKGYPSPPVNWSLSSERKRAFFNDVSTITGIQPA